MKWSDLAFFALATGIGIFLGNAYGYANAGRDIANNCITDGAFVIQGRVIACEEHVPEMPARPEATSTL